MLHILDPAAEEEAGGLLHLAGPSAQGQLIGAQTQSGPRLKRARSEAPQDTKGPAAAAQQLHRGGQNPLLRLEVEDALGTISAYLSNDLRQAAETL